MRFNYEAVNRNADKLINHILSRDKLVARQVAVRLSDARERGDTYRQVGVVQGWMHFSRDYVRRLLPDATVHQQTFGLPRVEQFIKQAECQAIIQKRKHIFEPLPNALLDRILWCILEFVKLRKPAQSNSTLREALDSNVLDVQNVRDRLAIAERCASASDEVIHEDVMRFLNNDEWKLYE